MKIIYKGTLHTDIVIAPTTLVGARLYNRAMQVKINMQLTEEGPCLENGTPDTAGTYKLYTIQIFPSTLTIDSVEYIGSASIPQGIYNLELFRIDKDDNPIIEAYYDNYAKVVESSFTQDYV